MSDMAASSYDEEASVGSSGTTGANLKRLLSFVAFGLIILLLGLLAIVVVPARQLPGVVAAVILVALFSAGVLPPTRWARQR
jgi:sulfite exporter TauE/SafE